MNAIGVAINEISKINSVSGESVVELSKAFSVLNSQKIIDLASSRDLSQAAFIEAVSRADLTDKIKEEIIEKYASVVATKAQDAANKGATVSTWSFKAAVTGLADSFKALSMASKVLLVITAAVAAFQGIKWIVDQVTVSLEEQRQKVKDLKEEYENSISEISSLEDEMAGIDKRIQEINALPSLSLTDKDELEYLQNTNAELQTRIALLEQERDIKRSELDSATKAEYEKDMLKSGEKQSLYKTRTVMGHGQSFAVPINVTEEEYAKEAIQRFGELNKLKAEGKKLTKQEARQYEELKADLNDIGIRYSGWAQNYSVDDETRQSWVDFADLISRTLDPEGWFERTKSANAAIIQEYEQAVSSGDQSAIAASFAKIQEAADKAGMSVEEFKQRYASISSEPAISMQALSKAVKDANTSLDDLQDAYKALSSAVTDYNENGYLSIDNLQAILALEPEYLALLQIENGQLSINTSAIKEMAYARIDDAEAAYLQKATGLLKSFQEEAAAAEYLKSKIEGLSGARLADAQAAYQQALADAQAKGGDFSAAAEKLNDAVERQRELFSIARSSIGQYTSATLGAGNAAEKAADKMKQAASSASSAIDSLLSMTISMLKQNYADADTAAKESIQNQIEYTQDLMDAQKEAAEQEYENAQKRIKAQQDLLKATEDTYNYQKSLTEKQSDKSKIQAQIDEIQFDDSDEAIKKRNKLLEDLHSKNSEIEDLQHDRGLDLQEEALSSELDRIKEIYDAKINSIEKVHDAEINSLQASLNAVTENARTESEIRAEAIDLINGKSQQFYNDLIQYNNVYGDGIKQNVVNLWNNAYMSLQTFGNGQIDVLWTLNSLALKMNDFSISTQNAANAMSKLADESERANDAKKVNISNSYSNEDRARMKSFNVPGFANGGVIDYTGPAQVHGTGSRPELALNNFDVKKLYEYIHSTPDLVSSMLSKISVEKNIFTNRNISSISPVVNINVGGDATENTLNELRQIGKSIGEDVRKSIYKDLRMGALLGSH